MITVLLSTYNGEKYLKDQIDSLLNQKNVDLQIFVRDDGSKDSTSAILDYYQSRGKLSWYGGDNIGPAKSFLDLIYNAPESDFYAFCDQDDVWMEDKLEIAMDKISKFPSNCPALYYGRPRLVDADLNYIQNPKSSLDRMLDYRSSIINSNATGCTMVFNKVLLLKVKEKKPEYIIIHDAWIHKICLICGGNLFFDDDVHILYRQHGNNTIGISNSFFKRLNKHLKSLSKKECKRSKIIISLLSYYGDEMNEQDHRISEIVAHYKDNFKSKLKLLFCKEIKSKYRKRNLFFKIAVLMGAF